VRACLGRIAVVYAQAAGSLVLSAAADPNDPLRLAYSEYVAALLRGWLREYEHAEALAAQALAQQGDRNEARTMLAEIYNSFGEGFDTRDLQGAECHLAELSL
jgi:hypothetical protein